MNEYFVDCIVREVERNVRFNLKQQHAKLTNEQVSAQVKYVLGNLAEDLVARFYEENH